VFHLIFAGGGGQAGEAIRADVPVDHIHTADCGHDQGRAFFHLSLISLTEGGHGHAVVGKVGVDYWDEDHGHYHGVRDEL
jgi:hypothetical protein